MTDERRSFADRVREELDGLPAPERRAAFLGLLSEALGEETDPILVGGGLVEVLTEGQYVTGDLDLVGDPQAIGTLLEAAGFEKSGRHLVDAELGLTVEVVASSLDPSQETERIRWRDHTLTVLSVEDLIVDRLCAAKFWDSTTDHEQARIVYGAHRERLDDQRLRARAEEEQVAALLDELDDRVDD